MEKKYKRIPFDLELAKAITKGEKEGRVVTRGNYPILFISFNILRAASVLVVYKDEDGKSVDNTVYSDGRVFSDDVPDVGDLFLEVPDEQEFKEGDVVTFNFGGATRIAIIKRFTGCKLFYPYVELVLCAKYLAFGGQSLFEDIRLATEEERQTLIDALKEDNSDKAREYLKRFFGIETPKLNFGDIVSAPYCKDGRVIVIYKGLYVQDVAETRVSTAAIVTVVNGEVCPIIHYNRHTTMRDFQPATEEEKEMLKKALENDKDNQVAAYNILATFFGEIHVSAPIEPKFEPFDKVLVRDNKLQKWTASFYSYFDNSHINDGYPYKLINNDCSVYCIPYNEQTKHLLGTTDDWEG